MRIAGQFKPARNEGRFNSVKILGLLKSCAATKDLRKGSKLHAYIREHDCLENNTYISNTLVSMYAKCGALSKAHKLLKELSIRDVVTWNALITGYVLQGQGHEALNCFNDMLHEGHSPDAVSFACVLKACGSIKAAAKGKEIHDKIVSLGMLEKHIVLGTSLVDMYVKSGALSKAQQAHDELPLHDVVSWSALIAGYAQQGEGEEALKCFDDMLREGHTPSAITFACVLKACGKIGAAAKGKQIHDEIISLGMLEKDVVLGTALVDMYVKCGALTKAQQVHEELPIRDVVVWSVLIDGYVQHGQGEEALKCFDDMLREGHTPTVVTLVCALKACGSIKAAAKGEQIHNKILNLGMLQTNAILGNSLVDMYVKCGALYRAQQVLEELPIRDVVSWNVLIAGYAERGQGEEALKCFDDMFREGHSSTAVTFACVLKACGSTRAAAKGEEIHEKIVRLGMLEKDVVLGTLVVDMYMKCGALAKASQVHKELPVRDVVSWNALIDGYVQQGQGEEALKCFDDMLSEGHFPTAGTFVCVLKACGSIGAVVKGKQIHEKMVSLGMLEKDIMLGNSLVDMYATCGALCKAQQVLEELPVHDVVSWSALIAGYAQQGKSMEAIKCFELMQSNGVMPNSITLTSVLNACSHSGLLDEAGTYFSAMGPKYGIHQNLDHYCCMIDLFGRVGEFNKAFSMIAGIPYDKCLASWVVLLGACCKWKEVKIGVLAFERALALDKTNAAVYVLMADIYTAAGMQEEAHKIEVMRVSNKAWKKPGCCWWTDATGRVHSFLVRDRKHAQSEQIYAKLRDLASKMVDQVYSKNEWTKGVLCLHSEMLATACALINTPPGASIFIVKNMRVCVDCHRATALISKIENREITVRDANCFHICKDGRCSCEDYW